MDRSLLPRRRAHGTRPVSPQRGAWLAALLLFAGCNQASTPAARRGQDAIARSVGAPRNEESIARPTSASEPAKTERAASESDLRVTPAAPQPHANEAKPAAKDKAASGRHAAPIGADEGFMGLGLRGAAPATATHARMALGQAVGSGMPMPAMRAAPRANIASAGSFNTEAYAHNADNLFKQVADSPLSTFSIDVDTASYSNVRRFLRDGQRPPIDAVRIEELINYFRYDYAQPDASAPFAVSTEVASAPWKQGHRLVRIGLRARDIAQADVPARNLVFLIDVSGSMQTPDKLPLLKRGLAMLIRQLRTQDRLAMVVYAGASGLVLPPTRGNEQDRMLEALAALEAGGSTNGAAGIELAYQVAAQQFVRGGVNRVILATDGDFNVGVTSEGELTRLIEEKRKSGVFLTVLGFGTGNLKDATMEALADKGNGHYAYIDSIEEARKVLVREAGSTLVTLAKDVKLQIEWNPARVASYRLIGYENRVLRDRDFNDDTKDAGEIGAGHTVTALYEVVPKGDFAAPPPEVDPLKYQSERGLSNAAASSELLTVKLRYKRPDADRSVLFSHVVRDGGATIEQASADFRWAAAVAGFGMLLRQSEQRGDASFALVRKLARSAIGADAGGDRREMLELVDRAEALVSGG
jgi:Ca-activated chloride channel family protein